ncbi:hypothetical protein BGW42_006190, partial [Actinomortierella wolfii]
MSIKPSCGHKAGAMEEQTLTKSATGTVISTACKQKQPDYVTSTPKRTLTKTP